MDEKEISRKLDQLEQHVINLIIPIQHMTQILSGGNYIRSLENLLEQPIKIDDHSVKKLLVEFRQAIEVIEKVTFAMDLKAQSEMIKKISDDMWDMKYSVERLNMKRLVIDLKMDDTTTEKIKKKKAKSKKK